MKPSVTTLLALAAIVAEHEPPTAPEPGPCVECGEPAVCFGRQGLRCSDPLPRLVPPDADGRAPVPTPEGVTTSP